eukprot:7382240-Prymnesium_polylepis.1
MCLRPIAGWRATQQAKIKPRVVAASSVPASSLANPTCWRALRRPAVGRLIVWRRNSADRKRGSIPRTEVEL